MCFFILGKMRLTDEETLQYVEWNFANDRPVGRTPKEIKEMYFEDTGIEISESFIEEQQDLWLKIGNTILKNINSRWVKIKEVLEPRKIGDFEPEGQT